MMRPKRISVRSEPETTGLALIRVVSDVEPRLPAMSLASVGSEMRERSEAFSAVDLRRYFHDTYLRTTIAVGEALADDAFLDPDWVERWDVAFARLYLDALDTWIADGTAPGPWEVALTASDGGRISPLRMVLLGMNAHINYDLPQALVAVITDDEFDDEELIGIREADHRRIDDILASRVAAEDRGLEKVEQPGDRTMIDRLLTPFNRLGTKRFLREARAKVWANARILSHARREGGYDNRISDLGNLSRRRVEVLIQPRYVVLELAARGFGVALEP